MFAVIVVTHGSLAAAYLDTLKLVLGESEGVEAYGLAAEDSDATLESNLEKALLRMDPQGKGALLLVDMLGGTPFNVSMRLALRRNLRVVTGVSLPMLFKTLTVRETETDLDHAAAEIQRGARDAVVTSADFYNRFKTSK
jgi:mannose/fructose/sorbose-specific phosphotransferase system IIA component